jgi:predicted  nucleic acid-binding Zn-ribbon protein
MARAEERKKGSVAIARTAKTTASGCKAKVRRPIMSRVRRSEERRNCFIKTRK